MFKGGALERVRLMNRLRNATAGTVKVLSENMHENLMLPQRHIGIRFIIETALLVAFVTCLTVLAITEKDPESLREASRSIEAWASARGAADVGTRGELVDFIAQFPEHLDTLVGSNTLVGSVNVALLRTTITTCDPPDGVPVAFGERCHGPFRVSDWATTPYGGPNQTFYSLPVETLCFGLVCAESMRSPVATHILTYPPPNYRVALKDGDAYIASRNPSALLPQRVRARSLFPDADNATQRERRVEILHDLFDDYVDATTRLVVIEVTMLNPFYMILTDLNIMFELPASGGVFATVDPRSIIVSEDRTKTSFTSGFVLAYSAAYLLALLVLVLWALFAAEKCVACKAKDGSSVLMFNCLKCNGPNELTLDVSACTKCGAPIPALRHRCWRRMIDIWYLYTLVNLIACVVWRYAISVTLPHLRNMIRFELDNSRASPDYVSFTSFGQSTELVRTASRVVTFCIVLTFIKCFNVICRGQTTSRFMRIFYFGLPELIPFVVTVLFTFSGFACAMHITLGYTVDVYSTLSASYLANYRILTLNAEWTNDMSAFERASATVLFVLFVIVSVFLMMNIFPSVLTVAYRRALATPQYDTEVLSLWLMIKPLLRKAGFVRTKRIGRRRARSITATLEDSFHDVEMDDDEKLAAKARRDGDGDGNGSGDGGDRLNVPLMQSPTDEGAHSADGSTPRAGDGPKGGARFPDMAESPLVSRQNTADSGDDGDWSDSQSEVSSADTASTAFVDDIRELDELKVAVNGDQRMMRTQIQLKELERTAEEAYLNGLDMEDQLNTTTQEVASLRDELRQLTHLLPALALGGATASLQRGRSGSVASSILGGLGGSSAAARQRRLSSTAASPSRQGSARMLLPDDDAAPAAGASDDDEEEEALVRQRAAARARAASTFLLGGAPPPSQTVASAPAASWRHVDSDDDDDLVDTHDANFERSFRTAFPAGHVPTSASPQRAQQPDNNSNTAVENASVSSPLVPVAGASASPGQPPTRKRRATVLAPGDKTASPPRATPPGVGTMGSAAPLRSPPLAATTAQPSRTPPGVTPASSFEAPAISEGEREEI